MDLKEVSQSSSEAKAVFSMFDERMRFRRKSDLKQMYYRLKETSPKIEYKGFVKVFENLQTLGIGRLVIGRKNNPDRFLWGYSLKDLPVAVRAGKGVESLKPLDKTSPKRRTKSKTATQSATPTSYTTAKQELKDALSINITLSPDTRPKDVKALLELLKDMQA